MKELVELFKLLPSDGFYTIIILASMLIGLYIITALMGKPLEFKLGPLNLKFGGSKPLDDSSCKKNIMIEQVKNITKSVYSKIEFLKHDTINRQVNYLEDRIEDIRASMADIYSDILESKLPEDKKNNVKSNKEYRNYQILLTMAMNQCLKKNVIKSFKQNHLDEIDQFDWTKHINQKGDTSIQHITEFLDIMYGDKNLITRKELSLANEHYKAGFKDEIKDCYEHAREISIKNKSKIDDLKIELEQEIQNITENNKCFNLK